MNNRGYAIFNKDFTDTQKNYIYNYARNYSLYDNNVLVLKGLAHSLALKEITIDLFKKDNNALEEDFLCNNGAILILDDLDSYELDGIKHTDIQLPTNINLISLDQIKTFKNFFKEIETYDEVINIGTYPEELKQELIKYPDIYNIANKTEKTKQIYKLFISLCEENLKEKIK